MLCKRCGAPLIPEDHFCPECGTPVPPLEEQIPLSQMRRVPVEPIAVPEPEPVAVEPPVERKPPLPHEAPKKKKHIALTVIAIVTAIALAAGGVFGWLYLRNRGDQETVYLLVRQSHYTEDGLQYGLIVYDYDQRGNLIRTQSEINQKKVDGQLVYGELTGEFDRTVEYSYDKNNYRTGVLSSYGGDSAGNQIEYVMDGDQIAEIRRVKTGGDGKETEEVFLLSYRDDKLTEVIRKSDGKEQPYYELAYDRDGRLVEEINHEIRAKYEFDYHEDGRIRRVKHYGKDYSGKGWSDWILRFRADYEYDKKGNLLRVEKQDTEGGDDSLKLEYNNKNKLLSTALYDDGELLEKFTYKYEDGKISGASHTEYDKDGNPMDLKLIYDENGNMEEHYSRDGSYTKYEYKAVTLSKADAERVRRFNESQELTGLSGDLFGRSYNHYTPFFAYYLVPTPIDPAYGSGPLHR